MGKEKYFGDKINTEGFDKNKNNINRKGQPVSIKKQLKELLLNDGELPIPAEQFIRMKKSNDKEYYIFKIPTQDALALRLLSIAMSKNTSGFNALKLLLETFDGKALQSVDSTNKQVIEYKNVSKQFKDE